VLTHKFTQTRIGKGTAGKKFFMLDGICMCRVLSLNKAGAMKDLHIPNDKCQQISINLYTYIKIGNTLKIE